MKRRCSTNVTGHQNKEITHLLQSLVFGPQLLKLLGVYPLATFGPGGGAVGHPILGFD